jgi:hypothetical protein
MDTRYTDCFILNCIYLIYPPIHNCFYERINRTVSKIRAMGLHVCICSLNRTYDLDTLEALSAGPPVCVACGEPAARKCSRCKAAYCGRYGAVTRIGTLQYKLTITMYLSLNTANCVWKRQRKICPCPYHKAYSGAVVQLHFFLTSAMDTIVCRNHNFRIVRLYTARLSLHPAQCML